MSGSDVSCTVWHCVLKILSNLFHSSSEENVPCVLLQVLVTVELEIGKYNKWGNAIWDRQDFTQVNSVDWDCMYMYCLCKGFSPYRRPWDCWESWCHSTRGLRQSWVPPFCRRGGAWARPSSSSWGLSGNSWSHSRQCGETSCQGNGASSPKRPDPKDIQL